MQLQVSSHKHTQKSSDCNKIKQICSTQNRKCTSIPQNSSS